MKHILFALLGLIVFSNPSFAQVRDPEVTRAEQYLKTLKTAQADFIQSSSLGARLSGQFYLDRPGKLRFNYNEVPDFIVADGLFVYFYDSQLGEQSNAPIGQTLADFLLRKDITLSGDLKVIKMSKSDGVIALTLTQTDDPTSGSVELFFNDIPYALARWRVTDAQGAVTDIVLKNLKTNVTFEDDDLFIYRDPKGRKEFNS